MRSLFVALLLLLFVPAAAQATSVRISNGVLRYAVTRTAQSTMTLTQQPGTIFVHDSTAPFSAVAPCRKLTPIDASCPDPTVRSISIGGGDHGDRFDVSTLGYPATISGGAGDDVLVSGLGADTLNGGDGNDTLDGGPGPDRLRGGRGFDTVTYARRTSGVVVSLDGRTNDGSPGERDYVRSDVEGVVGGSGNDFLRGGTGADTLDGGPGNDRIDGGSGADVLGGGPGRDTLDYSSRFIGVTVNLASGTATTFGERDRISGFEDALGSKRGDRITGDAGANRVSGGGGSDVLDGGLGPDILIGGGGFDTATYVTRSGPLRVSLDGRANDGAAGEGDNVTPSVDAVIGGRAGDVLIGNRRANTLRGGGGADRIWGEGGSDILVGGRGRDVVRGGKGNDLVSVRSGGADTALCGRGRDTAFTDRRDRVRGCEHVHGRHRR